MKSYSCIALLATMLFISACSPDNREVDVPYSPWQLVYQHDETGQPLAGDKAKLLARVRAGHPIRIGFGSRGAKDTVKGVEHFVDAGFLTITNGQELFAQIRPIVGQAPRLDDDSLQILFRPNLEWTMLVGTNGFSDRLMRDIWQDTIVGHRQRPTEVSWFVQD